jgi:hypothetical protein
MHVIHAEEALEAQLSKFAGDPAHAAQQEQPLTPQQEPPAAAPVE